MAGRRRRRWIIAGAICLVTVLGTGLVGEAVARYQLAGRAAELGADLPGVSLSLTGRPALVQLASGRIEVDVAVSDAALSTYAQCRTRQDLSVRAGPGGLVVTTSRTVRGMTLPVDVTLVPRQDGERWLLVADSVSAAGISVPAGRARTLLDGRDGVGTGLATRLLDGVPLPGTERFAITSARVAEGIVVLTASTSTPRTGDAPRGDLSRLRSCLTATEG